MKYIPFEEKRKIPKSLHIDLRDWIIGLFSSKAEFDAELYYRAGTAYSVKTKGNDLFTINIDMSELPQLRTRRDLESSFEAEVLRGRKLGYVLVNYTYYSNAMEFTIRDLWKR